MSAPENAGRDEAGRWRPGASGNPAGKPKGTRHRATLAAEALFDGEAEALSRKAIDLAKAGDVAALRMCLDRIVPVRKDRSVNFTVPSLTSVADAVAASAAILTAVAEGDLTPMEAADLSKVVDGYTRAIETLDIAVRLARLEQAKRK